MFYFKSKSGRMILTLLIAFAMTDISGQVSNTRWFSVQAVKDMSAVNFFVEQDRPDKVRLSLLDADEKVVWSDNFTGTSVARSLLLSEMPEGHYRLRAQTADQVSEKAFALKSDGVLVRPHAAWQLVRPTVAVHGRKVMVDCATMTPGTTMTIKILDDEGHPLVERILRPETGRVLSFDLSDPGQGNYRILFTAGDIVFERMVSLR